MTDEEWSALEQEWADVVRVKGAAEAAYRMMIEARDELTRALDAVERARKKAEKQHAKLVRACVTAEDWMKLAAAVSEASEVL